MSSFADEIIHLRNAGTWSGGGTPSKANADFWDNGDIPWVSPKDMKTFELHDSQDKITAKAVEASPAKLVPAGSVLMVVRSGILAHTFPVAIARRPVTLNQDMKAITPKAGLSSEFLAYQLRAQASTILNSCTKSGTTVASVETKQLQALPIWVPSTELQSKIVEELDKQLSRLGATVITLQGIQAKLKQARASILKAAVEGRLVELEGERPSPDGATYLEVQDFVGKLEAERKSKLLKGKRKENGKIKLDSPFAKSESIDLLPKGWTMLTVNDLCWDSGYGTSVKCTHEAEGDPVLRIPNIAKGRLDLANIKKTAKKGGIAEDDMVAPGDFLFVRTNGSLSILGAGCVILSGPPFPMSYASYLIRLRVLGSPATWKWFQLVWTSSLIRRSIESSAASSAGQNNLSLSKVLSFELPIPPESEINRILEIVDRRISVLDQVEATVQASLARCVMLRQAILKRAFEGRLVPAE